LVLELAILEVRRVMHMLTRHDLVNRLTKDEHATVMSKPTIVNHLDLHLNAGFTKR
jgi:hypothetical protein